MDLVSLSLPALAPRRAVLEMSNEDWQAWLRAEGQPPLRARQVRRWLIAGRALGFDEMTDLPRPLRERLGADFTPFSLRVDRQLHSCDGTEKLLLRLHDDQVIECVLLREADRRTVCISTQVGCGMGCVFCASGLDGVARNLSAGEILEQLLHARNLLPADERADPHRRHGHGRAAGQPRRLAGGPGGGRRRRRDSASVPGTSRFRRSACRPRSAALPSWASSITWPCRCTPPTTPCATRSCRPTTRPAWPPSWKRPTTSTRRRAGK